MNNLSFMVVGGIAGAIGLPYLIFFRGTTKAQRADYSMPEFFYCFVLFGVGASLGGGLGMLLDALFIYLNRLGIKI